MVDPGQNGSPYSETLDFEPLLAKVYDELTGNVSTIETKKDQLGNPVVDANGNPILEIVSTRDPLAYPLCNIAGGRYLLHHIRLVMNKHVAFGELDQDQISTLACNAIMQPIDYMMIYKERYGITDTSGLETEGLALFDSLSTYLTALKKAGIRNFGQNILTVQYVQKPSPEQQQQQNPGLYNPLTK